MIKELQDLEHELAKLPNGYLVRRGKAYYHKVSDKETGITKQPDKIKQLARKKYVLARMAQLQGVNEQLSAPKLIATLGGAYRDLPQDYFYHPEIREWQDKKFPKNSRYAKDLIYPNRNGVLMRSKSEVMISNLLDMYKIPYHYETLLFLGERHFHPDFTIKNPYTGKFIIWEHFGLLNKPGYVESMEEKMACYYNHGYKAFDNFIFTFEFDLKNPERMRQIIEEIIL